MTKAGRIMTRIGIIVGCCQATVITIFIICLVGIIYGAMNTSTTLFKNKHYDSIEELHNDYMIELYKVASERGRLTDFYYPKKMVDYFEKNNDAFVVCTYSSRSDGDVLEDALFVYIVKKDNNGYYLEFGYYGIDDIFGAVITLHNDYTGKFRYGGSYIEYKTDNYEACYGFGYKEIDDIFELYFDNVKMDEIKILNPFTNKEFLLCYAVSDKVYKNFFQMLFTPIKERHTYTVRDIAKN